MAEWIDSLMLIINKTGKEINNMNNFLTLGIRRELENKLNQNGILEPTPIQKQAIPVILRGKDVIAQAQTGTGKTLAFVLPMMEKIDVNKSFIQALIITPTRELAIQITAEAKKLTSDKGINILSAYGGQDVERQVKKLKGNIHMVIGTPGRLLDHINRKSIDLNQVKMFVLDEADQMLHMGFLKEVEEITRKTSKKRQTLFFSATIPKQIRALSSRYMREPVHIQAKSKNITLDEIEQIIIETTDREKRDTLCKIIDEYKPFMAIIFCRTKRRAIELNEVLQRKGYNSDELHGDLSQGKREKVMKSFRKLDLQFLVATDLAARGLDIEGITHIFNYDIAQDTENYIHRIGRTGRAGQTGVAVTLVTHKDYEVLNEIEKGIRMTIKRRKMVSEEGMGNDSSIGHFREYGDKGSNRFKKSGNSRNQKFGRKKDGDRKFKEKRVGGKKQNDSGGKSDTRGKEAYSKRSKKGKKF